MKVETIEEYLKRGGKVEVIPPQKVPDQTQTMKVRQGSGGKGEIFVINKCNKTK